MRWTAALIALLLVGGCSTATSEPTNTASSDLPILGNGPGLEIGQTYRYPFYIHCGTEWLIDINDTVWKTDTPLYDGTGRYREDLRQFFRNPDEQISPELWTHLTLVSESEIRLTLPDGTEESTYHPTDEEWPGCA